MDHETVLTFEYDDGERARRIERSIQPEIGAIDGDRTRVSLTRDDERILLTVAATDLVALRAGIHTWSMLVTVAEDTGTGSRT